MEQSLDALHERFQELVIDRPETNISKAHRRRIADKFAHKSLTELNEIADQLENSKVPCEE